MRIPLDPSMKRPLAVFLLFICAASLLLSLRGYLRESDTDSRNDRVYVSGQVSSMNQRGTDVQNDRSLASQHTSQDIYVIPDNLEQLADYELLDVYSRLINSFSILCRNHVRMGPLSATGKEICGDENVKLKSPCLVYSFGSNNDFDFEAQIVREYGCEVHTFDPTMHRFKVIRIPPNVTFHDMGIDGQTRADKKLYTLDDIVARLGHKGRRIDILKLDVEEFEWPALKQMLESGILDVVRQLLVEFHLHLGKPHPNLETAKRIEVLNNLKNYGFLSFSREKTGWLAVNVKQLQRKVSTLVEISFLNSRFL